MKKLLVTLFLLSNIANAQDAKNELFRLYKNGAYEDVCRLGFNNFASNSSDEEFVTIYAMGCLEADYIDRLAVPTTVLKFTEQSRANSSYFATILFQKKLLYYALMDGYDISNVSLPTTNYILSKVFDLYIKHHKDEKKRLYVFDDEKDKNIKYKLYLQEDIKTDKMIIEKIEDGVVTEQHIYW